MNETPSSFLSGAKTKPANGGRSSYGRGEATTDGAWAERRGRGGMRGWNKCLPLSFSFLPRRLFVRFVMILLSPPRLTGRCEQHRRKFIRPTKDAPGPKKRVCFEKCFLQHIIFVRSFFRLRLPLSLKAFRQTRLAYLRVLPTSKRKSASIPRFAHTCERPVIRSCV